jgi:hypothetical protein
MTIQTHPLGASYLDDSQLPDMLRRIEEPILVPYDDAVGRVQVNAGGASEAAKIQVLVRDIQRAASGTRVSAIALAKSDG